MSPTSSWAATAVRARQLLADAVEHLGVGLQVGVADLAVQLDNLLQLGDCQAEVARSAVDHRHVIAGHRFPGPVPDLPHGGECPLELLQRPLPLTKAMRGREGLRTRGLDRTVIDHLIEAVEHAYAEDSIAQRVFGSAALRDLGEKLFNFLDGPERWFSQALEKEIAFAIRTLEAVTRHSGLLLSRLFRTSHDSAPGRAPGRHLGSPGVPVRCSHVHKPRELLGSASLLAVRSTVGLHWVPQHYVVRTS